MSKFNFKKPDWSKVGMWCADIFRNNSSTIVGGMSMIGLALLCRKLNIPYTVLTEPFTGSYGRRTSYRQNSEPHQVSLMYLPSDAIEASIAAIYDGALNQDFDSQRISSAKEIFNIIAARKDDISDATKTYAITVLRQIAEEMDFDSGRKAVIQLISKIGKGEL